MIEPTEQDKKNLNQVLDYMASRINAVVIFHASDMILCANTDASYLTESQAHSYAEEYFFLGNIS